MLAALATAAARIQSRKQRAAREQERRLSGHVAFAIPGERPAASDDADAYRELGRVEQSRAE